MPQHEGYAKQSLKFVAGFSKKTGALNIRLEEYEAESVMRIPGLFGAERKLHIKEPLYVLRVETESGSAEVRFVLREDGVLFFDFAKTIEDAKSAFGADYDAVLHALTSVAHKVHVVERFDAIVEELIHSFEVSEKQPPQAFSL